jgi:hypothetical protein
MKYRNNLYFKLNNSGWIHTIFKKGGMIFQQFEKFHKISFVLRCGRLNMVEEGKFLIS